MSHIKDHSKKYKILEEMKPEKIYPCPNLDKILPANFEELEDSMTEQEFDKFVSKKFNTFYSKYVDSKSKTFFVNLPLEFFTKKNVERVRQYANIAFAIKAETADIKSTAQFFEDLHSKFLKILFDRAKELTEKETQIMQ